MRDHLEDGHRGGERIRRTGTLLRRVRLRSWEQDEARSLLEAVGFVHVVSHGTADDWVTVARRPG